MGLFDMFKKKAPEPAAPASASRASAPLPRGNIVEGEDGTIDFGRMRPDDPKAFVTMLGEYNEAMDAGSAAREAVARQWGFQSEQFSNMRHYMRRAFPGLAEPSNAADAQRASAAMSSDGAPCTFERYIEVRGAMDAWAMSRADIDGNLQRYFQATRNDVNRYALHWSPTEDIQKMMEHAALMSVHTQRYLELPM